MRTLSHRDVRLTLQFLPLVASVRWKLWRMPFPRLHKEWHALVQSELNRAANLPDEAFGVPLLPLNASVEPVSVSPQTANVAPNHQAVDEVWRCAHAVRRAARLVPHGSCLTQAMALQLILARRGQPCSVRIGVDHGAGRRAAQTAAPQAEIEVGGARVASNPRRFEAHAWVEWQGRVIMGGDITRWKPLTVFAPAVFPGEKTPLRSGEMRSG